MTTLTLPQEVWDQEIKEKTEPAADWLWQGFVARKTSGSIGTSPCQKTRATTRATAVQQAIDQAEVRTRRQAL